MTPDQLRDMMAYLKNRIRLENEERTDPVNIKFEAPTEHEMINAGLDPEGVNRLLNVPWWDEMVTDIIETPDMCEPEDTPQQVLEYARDVVSEYIRKRFPLEAD